jgi:hypothetical protein
MFSPIAPVFFATCLAAMCHRCSPLAYYTDYLATSANGPSSEEPAQAPSVGQVGDPRGRVWRNILSRSVDRPSRLIQFLAYLIIAAPTSQLNAQSRKRRHKGIHIEAQTAKHAPILHGAGWGPGASPARHCEPTTRRTPQLLVEASLLDKHDKALSRPAFSARVGRGPADSQLAFLLCCLSFSVAGTVCRLALPVSRGAFKIT